jgi:hypothetical protein
MGNGISPEILAGNLHTMINKNQALLSLAKEIIINGPSRHTDTLIENLGPSQHTDAVNVAGLAKELHD